MKNILFIGPYRQADGWGEAARANIKALNTTEHNLTIAPIYMGNRMAPQIDPLFYELERKRYDNYDLVIQNVLPHLLDYNSKLGKNVGMFELETSFLQHTSWPNRINTMDEAWVTSDAERIALDESNVLIPVKTTSQSVDLEKFTGHEPLEELAAIDKFKFYFIGEFIQRKGIHELLVAYFTEFHRNEDVLLFVKTNAGKKDVTDFVEQVQAGLGLYAHKELYPELKVVTEFVDDDTINRIHASCDCFVMPSYGESVCIPALEAMGFGNVPIVTDNTGMVNFVSNEVGWHIASHSTVVNTIQRPLQDLYTGHETWYQPKILDLKRCMRDAYSNFTDNYSYYQIKQERCKERIKKFSHENVGKRFAALI